MTKEKYRSGYIAVVGRPNVGKSTLVNALVGEKVSIVTSKPQTTQINILGIAHLPDAQIVLVDTPGLLSDKGKRLSSKQTSKETRSALAMADFAVIVVEANRWKKEDDYLMERLEEFNFEKLLAVNKIDLFKDKSQILDFLATSSAKGSFKEIVPISALRKKNINRLKSLMVENLPFKTPEFSKLTVTDKSIVFRISEIVREKLMKSLRDELPYSLSCEVDNMEEKNNLILIELSIILLKESHKKIVIGKNGRTLKQVGTESRKEIEKLLGKKVFLSSVVKSGQRRRV
jgi:GTP-binding protein Era